MDIPFEILHNEHFRDGFKKGVETNQNNEFERGYQDGYDKGVFLGKKIAKKNQKKQVAKLMIYRGESEENVERYTELSKDDIDILRIQIDSLK